MVTISYTLRSNQHSRLNICIDDKSPRSDWDIRCQVQYFTSIYLPLPIFLIRTQLFRYGKTPVNPDASILEINAREVIFFYSLRI